MDENAEEKQCRICLDGPDPELGRLIRPCLCKGSISYVHVRCLQRWRRESENAFFRCPQCSYRYMTARTSVLGLASNTLVIATLSVILFTCLAYFASFFATFFLGSLDEDDYPRTGAVYFGWEWISPISVASNLMRIVLRVLRDEDLLAEDIVINTPPRTDSALPTGPYSSGILGNFFRRIIIGIPVIGVASLVQLLSAASFLGPLNMLTRFRGRNRRDNSRDIATIIVVGAIILGILRALRGVYRMTEKFAKYILLRAEDAIIEVQ
ncbi:hypothetical protein M0805_003429 [Coniferiporia weirii]|nr:hypothetical protein M0805_003429 [Coniferiporia weirii]